MDTEQISITERFFADISNRLLEEDTANIPEVICAGLTEYLPFANVQRMSLVRITKEQTYEGAYSVAAAGYLPTTMIGAGLKSPYLDKISAGEMIVHSGPVEDVFTKDEVALANMGGIIAHSVIPIKVRDRVWGAIACSRYKNHDGWDPILLERIKTLGQVLAASYERYHFWLALQNQNKELESLSRHLMENQETERRLLSRELHDNFSQRLALLTIKANNVFGIVRESVKPEAKDLHINIQQIAKDMQALSRSLHPAMLEDLGLIAALKSEARRITEIKSIELQTLFGVIPELKKDVSLNLYRILQESLNNVIKHSQASAVFVSLEIDNNCLTLQIVDDGIGCKDSLESSKGSIGLVSIRERAQLINGESQFLSPDDGGFVVNISIPAIEEHYE
ncbi:GAF domain-containing sensor histidine kinase [Shewanella sp. KX20019]|uniref:GAF domain-containing sensor histidine kinase n=1 Tax=Shewanella sp. KX20019 TaxID=2803864 RepID=UPI00192565B5|nr:GAF domain-containing sensor histidine kinase [Shewanella sp. KX20019]QQX78357.1 GAF domain-containing sensor histidine kinase [Shewanella sp. KX20019]